MISDNIKLVPDASIGTLEFINNEFIWKSETDQFHLNMSQIETIYIDKVGSTALFTTRHVSRMLHFRANEDLERLEIVLMEFISDHRAEFEEVTNTSDYFQVRRTKEFVGGLDEATVNMLEAFSKIPLFAREIISKVKGEPQNMRRPRGINKKHARIPLNPWIIDKPMKLPASRIKPIEIDVKLEGLSFVNQATMIYNSGGKIIDSEMRLKLWSSVLTNKNVNISVSPVYVNEECDRRIEKDLNRMGESDVKVISHLETILKKYYIDDPEIGYVQGMSDLALPFARLYVRDGYAEFKGLMKRIRGNFLEDQNADDGISAQLNKLRDLINRFSPLLGDYLKFNQDSDNLFFTYRWFLVLFRREFDGKEADRLWDVMMAAEACGVARIEEYRIWVGLAMILSRKEEFMRSCSRFEDLLKYFNEMSGKWDLDEIIMLTDQLINQ